MTEKNGNQLVEGIFQKLARRAELAANASSLARRQQNLGVVGVQRDIDKHCGFVDTTALTAEVYKNLYDRFPIATRVVDIYPKECWKVDPSVYEVEDEQIETPFEKSWNDLSKQLLSADGVSRSYFNSAHSNPIWKVLALADELSGIGYYGVIYLGFNDVTVGEGEDRVDTKDPVEPRENLQLLFLRALDETSIDIVSYDTTPGSPREGFPEIYRIKFTNPAGSESGTVEESFDVHHSRIIHIKDGPSSSEIFGRPRQQPVYNNLYSLQKIYGGDPEMYWKNASGVISLETHPSLGADVDFTEAEREAIRDQMDDLMEGLERYMVNSGLTAKSLAPMISNPTPHVGVQLEAIAIQLAVPKRKLLGSERGELSSTQDEDDWNERLIGRQNKHITPSIVVPFIDRLITLRVLVEPSEGYNVQWAAVDTMTKEEKARVALVKTEALAKAIQGEVFQLLEPVDYLTEVLDLEPDRAEQLVENGLEDDLEDVEQEEELESTIGEE